MKHTHIFFEKTIIDSIDFEGYETNNTISKYDNIYNIFKSEYIHNNNKHLNEVFLFSEWLRGLPSALTVPFYDSDILKNAEKHGLKLHTYDKEEAFLNTYWINLSKAFFTLKNSVKEIKTTEK